MERKIMEHQFKIIMEHQFKNILELSSSINNLP